MDVLRALFHRIAAGAFLLFALPHPPLMADPPPEASARPNSEQLRLIREKSLKLLRDIVPTASTSRKRKTMENSGGSVDWGNLFDAREVVALVNLAPEEPDRNAGADAYSERDTWIRRLSFWAWEKDHWAFRQYLDNATNLEFHGRKDTPRHFVQASRKWARYEGDHLSWYYDPASRTLIPTGFEDWGPFYLIGDYLCTARGFERRAVDETCSVYRYKEGRKGELLGIYDSDSGNGVTRNFAITFRDRQTGKYWTFSFNTKDAEEPFRVYTVEAEEGTQEEKNDPAKPHIRYHGAVEILKESDGSLDDYCFERLTGLSRAILNHYYTSGAVWQDTLPNVTPLPPWKLKVTGDAEIVQRLPAE